jgi:hypothetical protein
MKNETKYCGFDTYLIDKGIMPEKEDYHYWDFFREIFTDWIAPSMLMFLYVLIMLVAWIIGCLFF